jgi:hypothetical protein
MHHVDNESKKTTSLVVYSIATYILGICYMSLHIFYQSNTLTVDLYLFLFLLLALFPLTISSLKSGKLLNSHNGKYKDLKELKRSAKKTGIIDGKCQFDFEEPFSLLIDQNSSIALIALGIEIEKKIRTLSSIKKVFGNDKSIRFLVEELCFLGSFTPMQKDVLIEIYDILIKSKYNYEYDGKISEWVKDNGSKILCHLDNLITDAKQIVQSNSKPKVPVDFKNKTPSNINSKEQADVVQKTPTT